MASNQYSYLLLRCYLDNHAEAQRLALDVAQCRHYAFICHDKDIWHDSSEEHNEGDAKKPHFHFVLNVAKAISANALRNKILSAYPKCGAYVQIPQDGEASVDYLTHSNPKAIAEGKHRYDVSEVVSDDYAYFRSNEFVKEVAEAKVDIFDQFVSKVLELGYCPRNLIYEYGQKGGKNFRYNYRKELAYCADCMAISIDLIWLPPETRWGIQQTKEELRKDLDYLDENRKALIKEMTVAVVSNVTDYICQKEDVKNAQTK